VAKSKERDKAEAGVAAGASLGAKEQKKLREKHMKLEKEANIAVTDYRRSISEWERTQEKWVEEMKIACQVIFLLIRIPSVLLLFLASFHFHEGMNPLKPFAF